MTTPMQKEFYLYIYHVFTHKNAIQSTFTILKPWYVAACLPEAETH